MPDSPPTWPPVRGDNDPPARHVKLSELLYGLLFNPSVLLDLQYERCARALRLVFLACLLLGGTITLTRLPSLEREVRAWARWLRSEIGTLTVRNGRLDWERPATVPYTTRHRGWRFDFVAENADRPVRAARGPERHGLVISPDLVTLWQAFSDEESVQPSAVVVGSKVFGIDELDLSKAGGNDQRIEGEEFDRLADMVIVALRPALLLSEVLGMSVTVIAFAGLFAVVPGLMNRTQGQRTTRIRRMFAFHLFASLPAVLVAALYSAAGLRSLGFANTFLLAFLVYHMLIMQYFRTQVARKIPPR